MVRWYRTELGAQDEEDYEAAKAELKRRFAAWADDKGLEVERDGPEGLLHYKWAYVDRYLTRWRRRDLYEIYLELYPAKVMAEADELDEVFAEAIAFITSSPRPGCSMRKASPPDALRVPGRNRTSSGSTWPNVPIQLRQAALDRSGQRRRVA